MLISNIDSPLTGPAPEAKKNTELGKEDFLQLLTVQLKFQDPLNPLQDTDFIAQMAQFSSLEQLTNMNKSLDQSLGSDQQLNAAFQSNLITSLVGKTVEVPTAEVEFDGDHPATVSYRMGDAAYAARMQILDGRNQLVREFTLSVSGGSAKQGSVEWDGRSRFDTEVPAGAYRVVVLAEDAAGQAVKADALEGVRIDAVRYDGQSATLWADGRELTVEDIAGVLAAE